MSDPCSGACGTCASAGSCEDKLTQRLSRIRHKIMVLSGKGGVGKSSVAVSLAVSLAGEGFSVGLLDIDFHGPSVPVMLGLKPGAACAGDDDGIAPVEIGSLKVMSLGILTAKRDDAVIWRGPMKAGVLKQLLEEVNWGDLDYLIIDFPPGTGDEALSACQLIKDADGGIIVTTPQEVSLADCRRCVSFCRQLELPVLGVVENMSGLVCPSCGGVAHPFGSGGGARMAEECRVPFLGSIPLDQRLMECCDQGRPFVRAFPDSPAAKAIAAIVDQITAVADGNCWKEKISHGDTKAQRKK